MTVLSPKHLIVPINTACHSQLIYSFIQTQHKHQICRFFSVFELYITLHFYCISFHIMIPIIFFTHDPFYIIHPDFTSFLLTETQHSITYSHTPSSFNFFTISLQSFYQPKHPISVILSFNKLLLSLLSHCFRNCLLCFIFHAFIPLLFSSILF